MVFIPELSSVSSLWLRKRKKQAELFGFDSRVKYTLETDDERVLAVAAMRQKKHGARMVLKVLFASWRPFEVAVFDDSNALVLMADHPFRFYFQQFEVRYPDGKVLGYVERRFAILQTRFDILDAQGVVLFSTSCPVWREWSFRFHRNNKQQARIHRCWTGEAKKKITKVDRFQIEIKDRNLPHEHRLLIGMAALFVELIFVRRKSGKKRAKKKKRLQAQAPAIENPEPAKEE